MISSNGPSSISSKVADAFAGDVASRLLPVGGFAKIQAPVFPTLLTLAALELRVYLALVLLCDGGDPRKSRRVRTDDLAELLKVTRRRVLLAIAELVRVGLVRRLNAGQGCAAGVQYAIVQAGENKPRSDPNGSLLGCENGSRRITSPPAEVIPPLPFEGVDTFRVPRSLEQTQTSLSRSISQPPPPRSARGRAEEEGGAISTNVVDLACRLFGAEPSRRVVEVTLHRFAQRVSELGELELEKFLRHQRENRDIRGAKAPIVIVCDPDDFARWRRRRELAKTSPAPANATPSAPDLVRAPNGRLVERSSVTVCMLTPEQLVRQTRAAAFLEPDPTRRLTENSKIDCGSTSPEQTAFPEHTFSAAEGGSR